MDITLIMSIIAGLTLLGLVIFAIIARAFKCDVDYFNNMKTIDL